LKAFAELDCGSLSLAEGDIAIGLGVNVYNWKSLADGKSVSWQVLTLAVWEGSISVFESQLPDVNVRYIKLREAFDRHFGCLRG
jgi:hypothetical protein